MGYFEFEKISMAPKQELREILGVFQFFLATIGKRGLKETLIFSGLSIIFS